MSVVVCGYDHLWEEDLPPAIKRIHVDQIISLLLEFHVATGERLDSETLLSSVSSSPVSI